MLVNDEEVQGHLPGLVFPMQLNFCPFSGEYFGPSYGSLIQWHNTKVTSRKLERATLHGYISITDTEESWEEK